jgi:eukaryotic sulfide quinone oxidoreductase
MQHTQYENVFGIGDCTNVPTSKTAAAAAAQFLVLRDNLDALMDTGRVGAAAYDGYTSCPLITKKDACMFMEARGSGPTAEAARTERDETGWAPMGWWDDRIFGSR